MITACVIGIVIMFMVAVCMSVPVRREVYRAPVWESDEELPPAPRHGLPVRHGSLRARY